MYSRNLPFIILSVFLVASLVVIQGCLPSSETEKTSLVSTGKDSQETQAPTVAKTENLSPQNQSLRRTESPVFSSYFQLTPQQKEETIKKALDKLEKGIFFTKFPKRCKLISLQLYKLVLP